MYIYIYIHTYTYIGKRPCKGKRQREKTEKFSFRLHWCSCDSPAQSLLPLSLTRAHALGAGGSWPGPAMMRPSQPALVSHGILAVLVVLKGVARKDLSMYACMHACMHACMYARTHACMHACMYVCMHTHTRRFVIAISAPLRRQLVGKGLASSSMRRGA